MAPEIPAVPVPVHSPLVLAVPEVDTAADARWSAWKLRGAESDRRSTTAMTWVLTIAGAIALGWLSIQLF